MGFYEKIKVSYNYVEFVANKKDLRLSEWEDKFLKSILAHCFFRGNYHLTEKQKKVLDKLHTRASIIYYKNSVAKKYDKIFRENLVKLQPIDARHLDTYADIYTENENMRRGFAMMLNKYGISKKVAE
jgi:hypothetical protein